MSAPARAWRETAHGLTLRVRLTPRAARDGIDGIGRLADGTVVLQARVRAVPEKGAANKALEKLLAKTAGVANSAVSVVSGTTARIKIVEIAGDPDRLKAALAEYARPIEH